MRLYDLYGLAVATEHELENPVPLLVEARAADVVFTLERVHGDPPPWDQAVIVDAHKAQRDGPADFVFARFDGYDAVRIGEVMDFYVYDGSIVCQLYDPTHLFLVEVALLGMVLALWCERRGRVALHASVVTKGGTAVGFLGGRGSGKTSMTTALLQNGYSLVVDDLAVLVEAAGQFAVERGYPSLRMWPSQAQQLGVRPENLSLVRPDATKVRTDVRTALGSDRFVQAGPAQLLGLFQLERSEGGEGMVSFDRLAASDAVMLLVRQSFLPHEVHRFGWQPGRLALFARLVAQVPIVRFRYPTGYDRLAQVVRVLEEHLDVVVKTSTDRAVALD